MNNDIHFLKIIQKDLKKEYTSNEIQRAPRFYMIRDSTDLSGNRKYNFGIVRNTMFLTREEADRHIKENSHKYTDHAHSYAMTADRSPQLEKLLKVLMRFDWDEIERQYVEK